MTFQGAKQGSRTELPESSNSHEDRGDPDEWRGIHYSAINNGKGRSVVERPQWTYFKVLLLMVVVVVAALGALFVFAHHCGQLFLLIVIQDFSHLRLH